MNAPSKASEAPDGTAKARWPTFIVLVALLCGMGAAAWQMAHRGVPDGLRDLTVLAPIGSTVTLDDHISRIPISEGVHAFSVTSGAHALSVTTEEGVVLKRELVVPAGIGPLMISVEAGPDDTLHIGYY